MNANIENFKKKRSTDEVQKLGMLLATYMKEHGLKTEWICTTCHFSPSKFAQLKRAN